MELAWPVAGPVRRGIPVAAEQGVLVAELPVAEPAADASTLLAAPVTVTVVAVVVAVVVADAAAAAAVAVSSIPAAVLPIRPAMTVQPACPVGKNERTHLHSLLLCLLLIWVE